MFWTRKKPAPTGTGLITENICWLFWDDAVCPGLISVDKFDALGKEALSETEMTRWERLSPSSIRVVSFRKGKVYDPHINETKKYYQKISQYLTQLRENDIERLNSWTDYFWRHGQRGSVGTGLQRLKANLNVLELWGYPIGWRDAYDAEGLLRCVIVNKSASAQECNERLERGRAEQPGFWDIRVADEIEYCVHEDEIVRIVGRPQQFTVEVQAAVDGEKIAAIWEFKYERGTLTVTRET